MSEQKRGFLGRLFGGREAPPRPEAPETPETTPETTPEAGAEALPEALPEASPEARPDDLPDALADEPAADAAVEEPVEAPVEALAEEPAEEPETQPEPEAEPEPAPRRSWLSRLTAGLSRSSASLTGGISSLFTKRKLDAATLEELEDLLIQADLGVETAMAITERIAEGRFNKQISPDEVRRILAEEVAKVLAPVARPLVLDTGHKPHVVLVVGVNGTGKTTTIGKLAAKLTAEGRKVMLAAGDTFRAAAIDQLKVWGERADVPFIAHQPGADPGAVVFDGMQAAHNRNADILIVDTAGRLHTKHDLMAELSKIRKVMQRYVPNAPQEVLLVIDATTGQNGLVQAQKFAEATDVTDIAIAKLDGTARGGIAFAISRELGTPISYVGTGEKMTDFAEFNHEAFVDALFFEEGE